MYGESEVFTMLPAVDVSVGSYAYTAPPSASRHFVTCSKPSALVTVSNDSRFDASRCSHAPGTGASASFSVARPTMLTVPVVA